MHKKPWLVVACILMAVFSGSIFAHRSLSSVFEKAGGFDFFRQDEYLPPVADFTFTSAGDCSDQAVNFTSTSTGEDLSYRWDFGDPNSGNNKASTQANPNHVFVGNPGNGSQSFTVRLTVTDKDGEEHTSTKSVSRKQIPSLAVGSDKDSNTFDNLPYFIVCENNGVNFTFYNHSTTKATNVKYEIDWGDGSPKFTGSEWETFTHPYATGIYNLKYTVTGENGCVATKTYGVFIGSNPAVGLGNPGNTNICSATSLTFPITSTDNNPVGTIYTVTFSDGSEPQVFNHPPPPEVTHTFDESSCGKFNSSGYANSFSATITAANPCASSTATVAPIYVTEAPEPEMEVPEEPVCVGSASLISNVTLYGNEVSPSGSCSDQGRFVWEISPATGWSLSSGSLGSRPDPEAPNSWQIGSKDIRPVFTEQGTYTITLYTGNRCGLGEVQETICVIPEPEPQFSLDLLEGCGPMEVAATNESNILGLCDEAEMEWIVSYSGGSCGTEEGWEFASGSDKNSQDPIFLFNNPGEYNIQLSITASCGTFRSETQTVRVYAPPTAEIAPIQDVCDAAVIEPTATVVACGTAEAIYKWTFEDGIPATSNALNPGSVEFTTPGLKTISLEVETSCGTTVTTQTFNVNESPTIDAGEDAEICNGEEVTLAPTVSPTGNHSYHWVSSTSGQVLTEENPVVKPNQTTTYTLTVTDDDTGCTQTDEMTVTVFPAPVIEFSLPDQVICSGETSELVSTSPLPPGATIAWTSQANGVEGVAASGTSEIPAQTLINRGTQPITVTYTAEITASEQGDCAVVPATYTITVNPTPVYGNSEAEICSGELLEFIPANHIPGTLYSWTVVPENGISGSTSQTNPQNSLSQTLENNGDTPATVIYTITPLLGDCQGDPFILTVTVQPSPRIIFSLPDQVICTGNTTEEVTIGSEVAGASFTWVSRSNGVEGVAESGSDNIPSQSLINPTREPIIVEYEVHASTSSGNSCEGIPKIYSITVNPRIEVDPLLSDFSGYQISCSGAGDGSIQLDVSGGDGNYTFSWTGPNGFSSAQQNLQNLGPGAYQVTISDGTGCLFSASYELQRPEPLEVELLGTTDVLCAGESTGSIRIEVSGGVENHPYRFEWTRKGAPFAATSQNLDDIPAGVYRVNVEDQNGCAVTSAPITISEPEAPLTITVEKGDISCYNANDGYIDIQVGGGQPPYIILWDFGSSQTSFDNMGPGIYTVTVRDNVGCTTVTPVEIVDAPLFQVTPTVQNISCHGEQDGSIQLNLEGKGPQTTIRWDHGAETENLFNLPPGNYGVTLTDPEGCQIRREFTIIEPAPLVLESQITDALDCGNPQSGAITLAVSGGTPPFSFRWSNGAVEQNLNNLSAGQYTVEVEDAAGCSFQGQFVVKRPEPLTVIAFRSTDVSCEPREVLEEIRISVSGGVAPYSIGWSSGMISQDGRVMTTDQPGLYLLNVTDGNGCHYQESFEVINSEVIVDAEFQSASFELYQSYMVNFEIQFENKSVGPISSYFWDFGDGNTSFEENPRHTYLSAGVHEITLTVTDLYGCQTQTKKKIDVFDYYLVVPNVFTPNQDGVNDHFFPKFLNIDKLEFWVLNKWGETIYHTDDLQSRGWDGMIGGDEAMPGNYVYRLSFHTLDGRKQTKTDVFLLLK
jgi:gliding motility-associated-like protein